VYDGLQEEWLQRWDIDILAIICISQRDPSTPPGQAGSKTARVPGAEGSMVRDSVRRTSYSTDHRSMKWVYMLEVDIMDRLTSSLLAECKVAM
jgi:hypothetical protein